MGILLEPIQSTHHSTLTRQWKDYWGVPTLERRATALHWAVESAGDVSLEILRVLLQALPPQNVDSVGFINSRGRRGLAASSSGWRNGGSRRGRGVGSRGCRCGGGRLGRSRFGGSRCGRVRPRRRKIEKMRLIAVVSSVRQPPETHPDFTLGAVV